MLISKGAALAVAIVALVTAVPRANANEMHHAYATIDSIERDLGVARREAGYFQEEVNRVQARLQWHAFMERTRVEQLNGLGCARPPSPAAWNHCMGLYQDMQRHAQWQQHLASVAEEGRARHAVAVNRIAELSGAGHWWRSRLAVLEGGPSGMAGADVVTGSLPAYPAGRNGWSRVVR